MRCTSFAASTMLVVGLFSSPAATGQDFTESGFITTWYFLGPYENPAGCNPGAIGMQDDYLSDGEDITEETFFPVEDMEVETDCSIHPSGFDPCYKNPDPDLTIPTVQFVTVDEINPITNGMGITNIQGGSGEQDTVDFNSYWNGSISDGCPTTDSITGEAMAYAVTYLKNNTGDAVDVTGELADDDSIQVIINDETVGLFENRCRFMGQSGVIQERFDATLEPGVNRVMVKLWEGCGHWAFRLRFTADFGTIGEPDFEIVPEPELEEEDRTTFLRGDTTADRVLNITDAVKIFSFLFVTGDVDRPECFETADVDNDGTVNLTDGVRILSFLFLGQGPPADPGPEVCGPDPDDPGAPGDLGCDSYAPCG